MYFQIDIMDETILKIMKFFEKYGRISQLVEELCFDVKKTITYKELLEYLNDETEKKINDVNTLKSLIEEAEAVKEAGKIHERTMRII